MSKATIKDRWAYEEKKKKALDKIREEVIKELKNK